MQHSTDKQKMNITHLEEIERLPGIISALIDYVDSNVSYRELMKNSAYMFLRSESLHNRSTTFEIARFKFFITALASKYLDKNRTLKNTIVKTLGVLIDNVNK